MSTPIWQVSDEKKSGLALTQFFAQQGLSSFEEAMEWSLREPNEFWQAIWSSSGVDPSTSVESNVSNRICVESQVLSGIQTPH